YRFSPRAKVEGRFNYPLTGNSISQGPLFAAGFEWVMGEDAQREPDPRQVSPEEYGKSNKGFVTYTGDATVVRVNDRFNLIKIDKGSNHGVVKGQIFDIFEVETDGRIKGAVARAVVTEVNPDESALRIKEYFKEVLIEQGFTAKALIE